MRMLRNCSSKWATSSSAASISPISVPPVVPPAPICTLKCASAAWHKTRANSSPLAVMPQRLRLSSWLGIKQAKLDLARHIESFGNGAIYRRYFNVSAVRCRYSRDDDEQARHSPVNTKRGAWRAKIQGLLASFRFRACSFYRAESFIGAFLESKHVITDPDFR